MLFFAVPTILNTDWSRKMRLEMRKLLRNPAILLVVPLVFYSIFWVFGLRTSAITESLSMIVSLAQNTLPNAAVSKYSLSSDYGKSSTTTWAARNKAQNVLIRKRTFWLEKTSCFCFDHRYIFNESVFIFIYHHDIYIIWSFGGLNTFLCFTFLI